MTPATRKRIGLALIAACPLLAALALPRVPTPTAAGHGKRLVSFTHWSTAPLGGNLPYQWIPGNRIVMKGDDGMIRIVDVNLQTDVRDEAIGAAFRRDPDLVKGGDTGPPDWIASPDGKWILSYWPSADQTTAWPPAGERYWIVASIDGKRLIKMPMQPDVRRVVWNENSDGWTELWRSSADDMATIYYLDGRPSKTVPLYPLSPLFDHLRPLGHVGPDRILLALPWAGPYFHALSVRTDKPGVAPVPIRYRMSTFAWIAEAQLSPDGDRMAWLLLRPADESVIRMRRMLPFTRRFNFRIRKEIWVSRLDGSGLHALAAGDPVDRNSLAPEQPQFIRWTPDGKRISYVYKNAVWAVDAG